MLSKARSDGSALQEILEHVLLWPTQTTCDSTISFYSDAGLFTVTYKSAVAVDNAAMIMTALIMCGRIRIPALSAMIINPPGKFRTGFPDEGRRMIGSL